MTNKPKIFHKFLISFLKPIAIAKPNLGHKSIAQLENYIKINVITQNIDGLHLFAGSTSVIELHGTIYEIVNHNGDIKRIPSEILAKVVDDLEKITNNVTTNQILASLSPVFSMTEEGVTKPNMVMFGDFLSEHNWSKAVEICNECDCIVVVGTSLTVYPAASLLDIAKKNGSQVISIDPNRTETYNIRMTAQKSLKMISDQIYSQYSNN